MSTSADIKGPYIVWENYGCEGWQPKSYATLAEALTTARYVTEFEITRRIEFEVLDRTPPEPKEGKQ